MELGQENVGSLRETALCRERADLAEAVERVLLPLRLLFRHQLAAFGNDAVLRRPLKVSGVGRLTAAAGQGAALGLHPSHESLEVFLLRGRERLVVHDAHSTGPGRRMTPMSASRSARRISAEPSATMTTRIIVASAPHRHFSRKQPSIQETHNRVIGLCCGAGS